MGRITGSRRGPRYAGPATSTAGMAVTGDGSAIAAALESAVCYAICSVVRCCAGGHAPADGRLRPCPMAQLSGLPLWPAGPVAAIVVLARHRLALALGRPREPGSCDRGGRSLSRGDRGRHPPARRTTAGQACRHRPEPV